MNYSALGITEEESVVQTVLMNTGLSDDQRIGNMVLELVQDLVAFLNQNERIDEIPNLRRVFRTLLDRETMATKDFLYFNLKVSQLRRARVKVDSMIDDLINDLDYEGQMKRYEDGRIRKEDEGMGGISEKKEVKYKPK
jgi:hypothetical protein